jgi:predicted lipoprotein with Yx(FWY)xxD motif
MRPTTRWLSLAGGSLAVIMAAAACSSSGSTGTQSVQGVQTTPGPAFVLGQTSVMSTGPFLTDSAGKTLYVFTADAPDQSNCSGTCATTWPPLIVAPGIPITGPSGATGTFGTITRSDGTTQLTYDHQPLYYYSGDTAAGQINGQGLNNNWYVALVTSASPSEAPASSPTPAATPDYGQQPTPAPGATTGF